MPHALVVALVVMAPLLAFVAGANGTVPLVIHGHSDPAPVKVEWHRSPFQRCIIMPVRIR